MRAVITITIAQWIITIIKKRRKKLELHCYRGGW